MVRLEENENIDQALKRMEEESKQVLSFGESIEEAPAEEVKEDAPVEESKEEAPAEEVKEDVPVEEAEPATEDQSAEEADVSSDK